MSQREGKAMNYEEQRERTKGMYEERGARDPPSPVSYLVGLEQFVLKYKQGWDERVRSSQEGNAGTILRLDQ